MSIIVAVHKQRYSGNIERVKLDDGRILDVNEAINEIKTNGIDNVTYARVGIDQYCLRSKRDNDYDNNLQNLPEF